MDYDLVPSQLKLNGLPSNERRQLSIVCVCVCDIRQSKAVSTQIIQKSVRQHS